MSVLGTGKISGHSGTAQKHRKAFKDIRALQKKKVRINGAKVQHNLGETPKWEARNSHHPKSKSMHIIVISIGFLCLLTGGYWMYNTSGFTAYQGELIQQEEGRQNRQKEEAYHLLVNSGENYFRANSFVAAQEEFTLALKLYPEGERALLGMAQTLASKCLYLEIDCQLAKDYQERMK